MFLLMCIPTRIVLTLLAKKPSLALIIAAVVLSVSFLVLSLNPSLRTKGWETMGQPIWWHDMRIVHAALWGSFAVAAHTGKPYAWKFLALDTLIGLASFFFLKK